MKAGVESNGYNGSGSAHGHHHGVDAAAALRSPVDGGPFAPDGRMAMAGYPQHQHHASASPRAQQQTQVPVEVYYAQPQPQVPSTTYAPHQHQLAVDHSQQAQAQQHQQLYSHHSQGHHQVYTISPPATLGAYPGAGAGMGMAAAGMGAHHGQMQTRGQ